MCVCVHLDTGWNAYIAAFVFAVRSLWLALGGRCYYCVVVIALVGGTFFLHQQA